MLGIRQNIHTQCALFHGYCLTYHQKASPNMHILSVVCQAIAAEQCTLCADVLPCPVTTSMVVPWPVKPGCGGEVVVKGR